MWLAVLALRNWRHPFTLALGGLGLLFWAVILVASYGDITCQSERMAPGDTCLTTSRTSGDVLRTQTYDQMREDQQRWTPILVPVFVIIGIPLAVLGFVSAHRNGMLWRGSGRRRTEADDGLASSAYAAQIAQVAATQRQPPPPAPPPTLHHDA